MTKDHDIEKGLNNSKNLLLYAGAPNSTDDIEQFKKAGGKIIFFISSEEKKLFSLKADEAGVTWDNDEMVKSYLLDNVGMWLGGQIGGTDEKKAAKLAAIMYDLVELHNFDVSSQKFLGRENLPTINSFKNYRWVEDGIPLSRCKGAVKGGVGVILAAGPSLNKQWEALRRIRTLKADVPVFFFVAGRTYKTAMKQDVPPDMVVEVEQFEWDSAIFTFAPDPPEFTILAGPITTCPGVFNAWPGNKVIMVDHNLAALMGYKVGEESLDGGNSILHHMFNMAVYMGCNTICLAGADLSYPDNAKDTHADGTFPAWPRKILVQEHNRQDPLKVTSTDGGTVDSSQPYKNFCTYLEIQIAKAKKKNPKLEVINFSPRGQLINGTTFKDIDTWNGPSSEQPRSSPADSSSVPALGSSDSALQPTHTSPTFTGTESYTQEVKPINAEEMMRQGTGPKGSWNKTGRKPRLSKKTSAPGQTASPDSTQKTKS